MSPSPQLFRADAIAAVIPARVAVERTRLGFERHAAGEWVMPPKVYVDAPPHGDFRAMPARGDGYALLKWVTSFPGNPKAHDLPVVAGALLLSDARTGELRAVMDCAPITSLRTGAAAALSAQALAREDARAVGLIGCGVNGSHAAACLAALGYGPGICADVDERNAQTVAGERGWRVGSREEAAAQDVVVTVTPGTVPVIRADDLRPGQHLAVLGADSSEKQELDPAALGRCALFCDEWEQAAGGGELSGAVARGEVRREDVTELGGVLTGRAPGRRSDEEITLFDSTGLAIQDLALAITVFEAWQAGDIAPSPGL